MLTPPVPEAKRGKSRTTLGYSKSACSPRLFQIGLLYARLFQIGLLYDPLGYSRSACSTCNNDHRMDTQTRRRVSTTS